MRFNRTRRASRHQTIRLLFPHRRAVPFLARSISMIPNHPRFTHLLPHQSTLSTVLAPGSRCRCSAPVPQDPAPCEVRSGKPIPEEARLG